MRQVVMMEDRMICGAVVIVLWERVRERLIDECWFEGL